MEKCCQNDDCSLIKGKIIVNNILDEGDNVFMEIGPITLPAWYDHKLMCKAQKYFTNNIYNLFVVALTGLTSLLTVPTILTILWRTNKSSKPATAYKRYFETLVHMMSWYQSDMRNPNSKGRQSICVVRKMHENATKKFGQITQKDLALTQFGFIGVAIIAKDKLGLPNDNKELIHFWRVIGHLIGIQDRFNLFGGCERCTLVACMELRDRIFLPGLEKPPENFKIMCSALLDGMWPIVPSMNPIAFFEFTRRILSCKPKNISLLPTISLYIQIIVHFLLGIPIISSIILPILNFQMWLTVFVQNTIPILAFYAFRHTWRDHSIQ